MYKFSGGKTLLDDDFILEKAGISGGMVVADLGCGAQGRYVFGASPLVGKNGVVYAIDILKTILESIKRRAKGENINNIKTIWSDLEIYNATKIEPNKIDTSLLINTLYQSHKRVEILREAIRITKKGGKIMVVEWKNIASPFGPPTENRVKMELLKDGAKKLGLKLEEEFEAGQYHYGLIFEKN